MIVLFIASFLFVSSNALKIWIPNTDVNNTLNWDKKDTPKDCDNVLFELQSEVATYWNLKDVAVSGLSLPKTGDIIFPQNVKIKFRNKEECPQSRDLKYTRFQTKGWLDPDNWKSDSGYHWLPHSERVPCAGESILFPPQSTFAIQLPSILVPLDHVIYDSQTFRGDTWSDFLKTDVGFQLFKGPDEVRSIPWRNDIGCSDNKKCICGRSPYTIRDGLYVEVDSRIFEEAVCLYAMPKCEPSACYSPVVPEGHCCGVCGAVIKIEDNTKDGLKISNIRAKVMAETEKLDGEGKLKTYVGRTRDGNIQIVIIAENSVDTIKSHTLANIIKKNLIDQKFQARISATVSGLRFSNYLFNSVSGAMFGTLAAVLILFASIYYIYLVLPKKKFQLSGAGNPFMFARFENTVNEENLEIGVEAEPRQELPQAFDNPMYSGNSESKKEIGESSLRDNLHEDEVLQPSEATSSTKEYVNPVFSELEKTKNLNEFPDSSCSAEDEFSEIKL